MIPKKYIKSLFTRVMLAIILFLSSSIFINYSDKNLLFYKKHLYDPTFNFSYMNKLYNKYLGGIVPFKNNYISKPVSSEKINFTNYEDYLDGIKVMDLEGSTIKTLNSGIVVFIGEKDGFGETIIVQGSDGVDYWYGNLENINVSLYDYLEKDAILGNPQEGILFMKFIENGTVLDYQKFI